MEHKIYSKREGNEKRMQREIHNSKYCKRKSESGKVENIPRTGSTKLIQKERETRNTFENRGNRKINVKIEGKIRITRNISKKRGKDENNSKTEGNERGDKINLKREVINVSDSYCVHVFKCAKGTCIQMHVRCLFKYMYSRERALI